ncbi:hypothetical protein OPT61_g3046 [Boeremia exigua]|uniref:Uncharacterized protein n=1 Tax=Boeremia exigua TaxID=749465 RepID=A0ACC2IJH8_9PLEO|nr:hypothetical protein OPT61_g3046 [Boeremia exigua]
MRGEFSPEYLNRNDFKLDYAMTYYLKEGYSPSEAYDLAAQMVYGETEPYSRSPASSSDASLDTDFEYLPRSTHGTSRRYEGKPSRGTTRYYKEGHGCRCPDCSVNEQRYGRSSDSRRWANNDHARSEYGEYGAGNTRYNTRYSGSKYGSTEDPYTTSRNYTDEELRSINIMLYDDLVRKGIHPNEASREANEWCNRHRGRRTDSSRSSGFTSFSNVRDAFDGYGGHARSSRSSRDYFDGKSRKYGWEDPRFGQTFTANPEEDFRYSSRSGSRPYRTEERRPGGFSSGKYNYNNDRSGWKSCNDQPPTQPSGVKPDQDLYKLLGVSRSATVAEIKQAHRKLCIKHHPDRVQGGPSAKKAATEKMAQINQACDVLKDKTMRAFYDRTGLLANMTLTAAQHRHFAQRRAFLRAKGPVARHKAATVGASKRQLQEAHKLRDKPMP